MPEGALLLHGNMWAAVSGSAADSSAGASGSGSGNGSGSSGGDGSGDGLTLEAGWLLDGRRCVSARRSFAGDRLSAVTFTAARRE